MSSSLTNSEGLNSTPLVSVVIPAYCASAFIVETLKSVFDQTFTDYEVIVVNDGSPDTKELESVIEPWINRIVYLKQENQGPSAARNAAIKLARGEYIAMLDSDDSWLPNYLAEQIRELKSDPQLDMIYSDALLFGDAEFAGRTFMECSPSSGPVTFESLLTYQTTIITTCSVVRKSALLDAGLFDPAFIRCEDFDLWLRLTHQGSRISYKRQVLARHRVHNESLASSSIKMVESQINVLKKTQRTLALTEEQQALLVRQLSNCNAQIDLENSKRHLVAHDYPQARQALQRANEFYRSAKLRLVLGALSVAPRVLHKLFLFRQNLARTGLPRLDSRK